MDRDKALDRVRKCLELSSSPNPHEAAAAMRQAQKLMRQHSISERELGLLSYGKTDVHCPIQYNKKAMPLHLAHLVQVVMTGIGVKALVHAEVRVSDYSYVVTYYGPLARTEVAKYVHELLYRAANRAWEPVKTRQRAARTSFLIGWYEQVRLQVPLMVVDQEELDKTLELMKQDNPDDRHAETNDMQLDRVHLRLGAQAAKDFRLHRPLS